MDFGFYFGKLPRLLLFWGDTIHRIYIACYLFKLPELLSYFAEEGASASFASLRFANYPFVGSVLGRTPGKILLNGDGQLWRK